MHGVEADGACGLHDLGVEAGGHSILRRDWGWFFWLGQLWHGNWWDLRTGIEGWDASALVLWFVIVCGGGGAIANEQGGFGVFAVAIAIGDIVEGTGSVDMVGSVV